MAVADPAQRAADLDARRDHGTPLDLTGPASYAAPMVLRSSRLATALLVLFLVVTAARLVAIPADLSGLARGSTFALMPSLALWVLARRGPTLVVAALLFSAAGDVLLGFDGLFLAGMGAFAVAHVLYVTHFVRRLRSRSSKEGVRSGVRHGLRRRWSVPVAYALALGGLIVWLWPGLGELRIPVAVYALLLTATATTSGLLGLRLGLGGALFFVSDAMIAAWDIAERPEPPMPGLWVMSTYILAQYLLASGAWGASRHDAHTDPQLRNDGDLDRQPGDGDQRLPGLRPVV